MAKKKRFSIQAQCCLFYTPDAADDMHGVVLGMRGMIKKKKAVALERKNILHTN